jgi:hypothetical protein
MPSRGEAHASRGEPSTGEAVPFCLDEARIIRLGAVPCPAPDRFRSSLGPDRRRPPPPEIRLETARTKLGQVFTIEEETWTDNRLAFRVRALGQAASGTIDVAGRSCAAGGDAPWPLAQIAEKIQRAVQSQGTTMLEKK